LKAIKIIVPVLLLSFLLGCGNSGKPTNSDVVTSTLPPKEANFRDSSWGDTKEDVKGIEASLLKGESQDELVYSGKLYDLESEIKYKFIDGKLIQGSYWIKAVKDVMKPSGLISDYDNIKNKLSSKYGAPKQDKEEWKTSPADSDKSRDTFKMAGVQMGALALKSVWIKDNTEIVLNLSNPTNDKDNFSKYHFFIQYSNGPEGKI